MAISITYEAIDGVSKRRVFKKLAAARNFAHKWVGEHPDVSGLGYAVSYDGIGRVIWYGCSAEELFPE